MQLLTAQARAYVYSGDWVADCPSGCGNVEHLYDRANPRNPNSPRTRQKTGFHCSYCKQIAGIDWPPPEVMAGIVEVLGLRPVPHTRNWYPKDHDTALKYRVPHGQTVDELREENIAHDVPPVREV